MLLFFYLPHNVTKIRAKDMDTYTKFKTKMIKTMKNNTEKQQKTTCATYTNPRHVEYIELILFENMK